MFFKGAAIEKPNSDGNTPLHAACENGHVDMVEFLLTAGQYYLLSSLLSRVEFSLEIFTVAQILTLNVLATGASVSRTNHVGLTPLATAEEGNHSSVVNLLSGLGK